eukprot:gene17294-8872_t
MRPGLVNFMSRVRLSRNYILASMKFDFNDIAKFPININHPWDFKHVVVIYHKDRSHLDPVWDRSHFDPVWDRSQLDPVWDRSHLDPVWDRSQLDPVWDRSHLDPVWDRSHLDPVWDRSHFDPVWDQSHLDPIEISELDMADALEKLKKKRRTYRATTTKTVNKIDDISKQEDVDVIRIQQLLSDIREKLGTLKELDDGILEIMFENNDDEACEKEAEEANEIREKVTYNIFLLEKALKKNSSSTPQTKPNLQRSSSLESIPESIRNNMIRFGDNHMEWNLGEMLVAFEKELDVLEGHFPIMNQPFPQTGAGRRAEMKHHSRTTTAALLSERENPSGNDNKKCLFCHAFHESTKCQKIKDPEDLRDNAKKERKDESMLKANDELREDGKKDGVKGGDKSEGRPTRAAALDAPLEEYLTSINGRLIRTSLGSISLWGYKYLDWMLAENEMILYSARCPHVPGVGMSTMDEEMTGSFFSTAQIQRNLTITISAWTKNHPKFPININHPWDFKHVVVIYHKDRSHLDPVWDRSHFDPVWDRSQLDPVWDRSHLDPVWDRSQLDPVWDRSHLDPVWDRSHLDPVWDRSHFDPVWDQSHLDPMILYSARCPHVPGVGMSTMDEEMTGSLFSTAQIQRNLTITISAWTKNHPFLTRKFSSLA